MTPLEKASQMIVDYQLTIKSLGYEEAVQCAIRTVDDIIQELNDNGVSFRDRYWQEVKHWLEKQVNKMTLRHALLILESHQKWRMGDEFAEKTEPKVLTEAINTILQYHVGSTTALIDQIGEANKMVTENTSDGYHTFKELYEFRKAYNVALFNEWGKYTISKPEDDYKMCMYDVHKSWRHNDGELCFGGEWFIVVAYLPDGQISNHYEAKDWDLFKIPEREKARYPFDGHTGQDVINRLLKL